jgi:predicted NAD/FAD-binding protein
MRIAIVGSGVSGLVCAHLLSTRHDVTLFEADDRPGGHAHTVEVEIDARTLQVDTGFLVYNERTYPGLVRLFETLGIDTQPSDMSFSVVDERTGLEYGGPAVASLFAQRRNLLRPAFLRMLADVARFHRAGQALLASPPALSYTLADLLEDGRWSRSFIEWYLLPLGSSIWSADPGAFARMSAVMVLRFFDRHGMLSFGGKPSWRTVSGGSRRYVDAIVAPLEAEGRLRLSSPVEHVLRGDDGVTLRTKAGRLDVFDHVVLATHSDQALAMVADASKAEKETLGALGYQDNSVILHTDERLMPANRRAWAAWNYHRPTGGSDRVTMTYLLNRLQGFDELAPVMVTLNRDEEIEPSKVLRRFEYAHPVLDAAAVKAQERHAEISGSGSLSFCGAYWGSGFHEDGLQSAVAVCRALGVGW